ncbi:MAG: TspO/MBR family protein [Cytophagales bacterium]|nr:TspO/MBR family protein [Cytophagales bacterium]
MVLRVVVFIVLNFAALGIGGALMGKGAASEWYQSLNKAPWTPPGWVFGAAWFSIMICYGFYMAKLWSTETNRTVLLSLFAVQWLLNVAWNPAFFRYHQAGTGLILISLLTILIGYFLIRYVASIKYWNLLILPYFIWLLIATSLNAYIYFKN